MTIDPALAGGGEPPEKLDGGLDYHFSAEELKAMAVLLRRGQAALPDALASFSRLVERRIYASMSVAEVCDLYSSGRK